MSGKIVLANPDTGELELSPDFGEYKDFIKSNKNAMVNRYKSAYKHYTQIKSDEKITNKQQ